VVVNRYLCQLNGPCPDVLLGGARSQSLLSRREAQESRVCRCHQAESHGLEAVSAKATHHIASTGG
jgi:hypothetical protein